MRQSVNMDSSDRLDAGGDRPADADVQRPRGESAPGSETMERHRPPAGALEFESRSDPPAQPREQPTLKALDELERLRELVAREPVVLIVPPEIFIQFYPAGPEQVINALQAAGFDQVHFESLGDELVALAYLRMWRDNEEKRTWIRSTNPIVVEYCRAKHPELLPYLAPIVPPALALARYLRHAGEDRPLIYAGLDFPEVNGERHFAAAVSLAELATFLRERRVDPLQQSSLMRSMPPERRRFLAAAGGLPLAMLDAERMSSRDFSKLRGLHYLGALSRLIDDGGSHLGFIDILPYDGNLDHPGLGPADELYWRRGIMELAEPEHAESPVIDRPEDLDLAILHRPRRSRLPHDTISEIEQALEEARTHADDQQWTLGSSDFAEYLSLTESMVRNRPDLALGLLDMSRNYFRAMRDATHDALTDLYSYRALVERAREELGQANRAGANMALLFVDLDRFK
ncbi:MAG: diguanylate cyclase, partial [Gemmatimonadetes bacterium]|nr:diguanylate cyclase [Gemmatimonadota bacterium]